AEACRGVRDGATACDIATEGRGQLADHSPRRRDRRAHPAASRSFRQLKPDFSYGEGIAGSRSRHGWSGLVSGRIAVWTGNVFLGGALRAPAVKPAIREPTPRGSGPRGRAGPMTPGPVNLGVCGGPAPARSPAAARTTPFAASASAPLRADHLPPAPTTPVGPPVTAAHPPSVRGKFLFAGDEKFYVRGVTYGTFGPRADGSEVPEPEVVERDFALMAANGINAVRIYTVPPRWLLDAAQHHRLRAMIGLPVERYIGFLADKSKDAPDIEELVRACVRASAGHPAVRGYAIGNEIPASLARWFGRRRVERYLERLYRAA